MKSFLTIVAALLLIIGLHHPMADISNQSSASALGRSIIGGSAFSLPSAPAAGSQATVTQSSATVGGVGVRNVADCISFSAAATTAPVATNLTVNLRDGATGAGTILHTWVIVAPATVGTHVLFSQCGYNISGSPATAMTLEFSGALASEFESVSLRGYTVQ